MRWQPRVPIGTKRTRWYPNPWNPHKRVTEICVGWRLFGLSPKWGQPEVTESADERRFAWWPTRMTSDKIVWLEWYRLVFVRERYGRTIDRYTIDEWVTKKLQDKEVEPPPMQPSSGNVATYSMDPNAGNTFTVTLADVSNQLQLWQQYQAAQQQKP